MAFIPGSIANQFSNKKTNTTGFVPGSIANQIRPKQGTSEGGFVSGSIAGQRRGSNDLKSADGLYRLAVEGGLKDRADSILASQQGEKTKEIFSGGFISDTFDVLNALQYGTVGLLKGKTFSEGVKTRQSFTDKDALGDKGLPGVIAGTLLDIAFDPLTYIAPTTIVKKIPFATKLLKGAKEAVFGKTVLKEIVESASSKAQGVTRLFEDTEGGTKLGRYLSSKLVYMQGADPIFREGFERSAKNTVVSVQAFADMGKFVSNMAPETAAKILTKDKEGRFLRANINELQKVLNPEEFGVVSKFYNDIDSLGKEAVDLGLLSKKKYEEHLGEYIKSAFLEHETTKSKGVFGFSRIGIKGIKGRKQVENISEFGLTQVDNPAYLLFKTAVDLTKDVENAKLFKQVANKFGTEVGQEGFTLIPKTSKFTSSAGKQSEILSGVKKINTDLKPLFKELKMTFKADRKVLAEIVGMERRIGSLGKLQGEELYKFFNEGIDITKTVTKARKLGIINESLQPLANTLKKFKNLEEFKNLPEGIQLEKAFINGDLQRGGFKSMQDFLDTVKNPFKASTETSKVTKAVAEMPKIIKFQKEIEKLVGKSKTLSEIDKRSINDSFRFLEKNINDLRFGKEDLLENLADAKLGDLAGKYIPNQMAEYLQDIINPAKDTIAKNLVANFKFFKVVMNPGTHARNIISNKILNYWKLGMNPLDPRVLKIDVEAGQEIFRGTGKWIDEATPLGYNANTFIGGEMRGLLDSPEAISALGKGNKLWQTTKKKLGDIYQGEENHAKLSAYIFQRTVKNMEPEAAWKAAEAATFNYAQVTPFVRKLRESLFGFPFITFTVKSTPAVAEVLVTNPNRVSVIGKIKQGIENLSDITETDRERASEPSWVKDGFYIKLPMKDKEGRSSYFDLTYILPFGDLLAGNFFERNQNMETGVPENYAVSVAKKSPFIQTVMSLGKNKDFYGNSIWKESDSSEVQLKDLMIYLTKSYVPPTLGDQLPGGYNQTGERQNKGIINSLGASDENQRRNLMQELLRNVGAKIQPIDADMQETYQEWNKRKAMQTLLRENALVKSMNIDYVPKDK